MGRLGESAMAEIDKDRWMNGVYYIILHAIG